MLKKTIPYIFGVIGAMILVWGAWLSFRGLLSAQWPTTNGVVLSSENTESATGNDHVTTYGAKVRYEYFINSRRYTADRLSFGEFSDSDSGHAARIMSRYPAGTQVRVYYNPRRPEMSVLEPGTDWGNYIPMILGAAFIAVSLIAKSAERQVAENLAFSEKKALNNEKRVLVSRDYARVTTNYPPVAIGMGAIFLVAGLGVLSFGLGGPGRTYAVVMGGFFAVAGGTLAWFTAKVLRLRNIRNRNSGHSPWKYDRVWDRSGCNEEGFTRAFRVLYAVTMITSNPKGKQSRKCFLCFKRPKAVYVTSQEILCEVGIHDHGILPHE